jgi:phenylacetate-CoA ligase
MHGLALIYILRDLPQIRNFKITQESVDLTSVSVVSDGGLNGELVGKIVQGFKARLGQEVEIRVEEVKEIPSEKSGKFRYVVSKVAPIGK